MVKYKILALAVGTALLVGCNSSSNSEAPTKQIQAYDGAVWGMEGTFSCDDGTTGSIAKTNYDGYSSISAPTFVNSPETCEVTFVPTPGAVDTSNGKDMSKVSYTAPKGLFVAGEPAAATPFSTLVQKELGDEVYSEEKAKVVLKKVGIDIDQIANDSGVAIDVNELLKDPDTVLNTVKEQDSSLHSQLSATTVVLSDTLTAQPNKSVDEVAKVTSTMTEGVLTAHPNYPTNESGEDVFVDLTGSLEDETVFDKVNEAESAEDIINDPDMGGIIDDVVNPPATEVPDRPEDPDLPPPTGGGGNTAPLA